MRAPPPPHRVATLQPPAAPRRQRTHPAQYADVSAAWSTENNASSSPTSNFAPSPFGLSGVQHSGGLYAVDEAQEQALNQYLARHLPTGKLSPPQLPTPETPLSQSADFARGFSIASSAADQTFEYLSPSLDPFAMDETSAVDIGPSNLSIFEAFTPSTLPGLGIRLPLASLAPETRTAGSFSDESVYTHSSDITRIRDDTTYTARDDSSGSVGAPSSVDMVVTMETEGLPAEDGLPTDLMNMAMNMTMSIGGTHAEPDTHTSMVVNLSQTSAASGAEPASSVPSAGTTTLSNGEPGSTPFVVSTPLNSFERSHAPPPSSGSHAALADGRQRAVSRPPEEKKDDELRAMSTSSTPSHSGDDHLPPIPSFRSPPPAVLHDHDRWSEDHDYDHDPDHDLDRHANANVRATSLDEMIRFYGAEDDDPEGEDVDGYLVNQEDVESRLRDWSLTTIEDWKDKLLTVIFGALPSGPEFEAMQKDRMQRKRSLLRGKVTKRQASALDKGKQMFQEITRIFLDMLDVPSSVGAQRLGRWSPYLSNESPWNMWQRKWAAEHEHGNHFTSGRWKTVTHTFLCQTISMKSGVAKPITYLCEQPPTIATFLRHGNAPTPGPMGKNSPRVNAFGDGATLPARCKIVYVLQFMFLFMIMVESHSHDISQADTWEQTHGFSSIVLACTLVPEDKFDQFTFFYETPQMTDFSVQRLGQTDYNARLLAFHWLGDRQARKLTSHPEIGGSTLTTGARRRLPLPTVAKMRKIYADAVIHLEKQCAQLNPSANLQVSARARWRDWDSFLIDAGCTLRNWPNSIPWPWDLTENRGSATQALLTPLYYAATGFNSQPKLQVTLWDEEEDPTLMVRADGTAFRLSEYEARKAAAFKPLSKAAKRLKKDRARTRTRGRKRASYSSSSSSSGSEDEDEDDHDHDHGHVARKRPRTSGESDHPQPAATDAVAPSSIKTNVPPPHGSSIGTSGAAALPLPRQTQTLPDSSANSQSHQTALPPLATSTRSPAVVGVNNDGPPPPASVLSWERPAEPWSRAGVPHGPSERSHLAGPGGVRRFHGAPQEMPPPLPSYEFDAPQDPRFVGRQDGPHYPYARGGGRAEGSWRHNAEWGRQPASGYLPSRVSRFRSDRNPYADGFDGPYRPAYPPGAPYRPHMLDIHDHDHGYDPPPEAY
ncbi:hypothetical protein CALVIDRAFT_565822 [Calocera viscosa TUFC12733]|uniref:Uncharacterized protein n=1 Tax=Calocera viscosa (strain TUFC12733) TaxID=1330018 RepID=A0A167K1U9_CALVF|nr:hypothetical protein CALVIDRAFT_565822 [Calocera viscosa TUFC12733]